MGVRVIEVHESVYAQNDKAADKVRALLTDKKIAMFNIMSSPGSGKTTLLTEMVKRLTEKYRIMDMDVDIRSELDAKRVSDAAGINAVQIHNGGLCHIDADMTGRALCEAGIIEPDEIFSEVPADEASEGLRELCGIDNGPDIIFLENIGNLVCPAEFDTGAHRNIMILSVPEGDDKPLKYPLMFSVSDLVIISKTDTKAYFDFDDEKAIRNIRALNPEADIIFASAKTGEGVDKVCSWCEACYAKIISEEK